jgi:predicted MFS family arabinose efflux permease
MTLLLRFVVCHTSIFYPDHLLLKGLYEEDADEQPHAKEPRAGNGLVGPPKGPPSMQGIAIVPKERKDLIVQMKRERQTCRRPPGKPVTLTGKVKSVDGRARTTEATDREVLLTRPVVLLTLVAFAALFGFQLLLSVVPLYADEAGGGSSGAGLTTAVFMLSTVLTQIQMPRILGRYGYRRTLAAGLLFIGIPALFYAYAQTLVPILAVTLVRGVGFGIITVVFAALIVELAPPGRTGEALGLIGVAITVPNIFCNALGLWLVGQFGYGVVFLLGGVAPLLGLGMVAGIRAAAPQEKGEGAGFFAGLGRAPLLRILLLFAATTMAGGVVLTFLPLAVPGSGVFSAAGALLVVGVTSTASRWWAGRFGDRRDPRLLLAPGILACAAGMVCLPLGGVVLLVGAVLFGTGFGLLQNATLILMMGRVSKSEYGLGSTLWNAAFDAGTGIGAFAFGFVISAVGFSWSFYICAALVASALLLVILDYSSTRD